jgi:hypothetical protein
MPLPCRLIPAAAVEDPVADRRDRYRILSGLMKLRRCLAMLEEMAVPARLAGQGDPKVCAAMDMILNQCWLTRGYLLFPLFFGPLHLE